MGPGFLMVVKMGKGDLEEWNERRFKKIKMLADSMYSSDSLKELVDSIKYGLNLLNLDLILTKRFLEYAKARYEEVYREEFLMEEEDEKVMDELDAMRE